MFRLGISKEDIKTKENLLNFLPLFMYDNKIYKNDISTLLYLHKTKFDFDITYEEIYNSFKTVTANYTQDYIRAKAIIFCRLMGIEYKNNIVMEKLAQTTNLSTLYQISNIVNYIIGDTQHMSEAAKFTALFFLSDFEKLILLTPNLSTLCFTSDIIYDYLEYCIDNNILTDIYDNIIKTISNNGGQYRYNIKILKPLYKFLKNEDISATVKGRVINYINVELIGLLINDYPDMLLWFCNNVLELSLSLAISNRIIYHIKNEEEAIAFLENIKNRPSFFQYTAYSYNSVNTPELLSKISLEKAISILKTFENPQVLDPNFFGRVIYATYKTTNWKAKFDTLSPQNQTSVIEYFITNCKNLEELLAIVETLDYNLTGASFINVYKYSKLEYKEKVSDILTEIYFAHFLGNSFNKLNPTEVTQYMINKTTTEVSKVAIIKDIFKEENTIFNSIPSQYFALTFSNAIYSQTVLPYIYYLYIENDERMVLSSARFPDEKYMLLLSYDRKDIDEDAFSLINNMPQLRSCSNVTEAFNTYNFVHEKFSFLFERPVESNEKTMFFNDMSIYCFRAIIILIENNFIFAENDIDQIFILINNIFSIRSYLSYSQVSCTDDIIKFIDLFYNLYPEKILKLAEVIVKEKKIDYRESYINKILSLEKDDKKLENIITQLILSVNTSKYVLDEKSTQGYYLSFNYLISRYNPKPSKDLLFKILRVVSKVKSSQFRQSIYYLLVKIYGDFGFNTAIEFEKASYSKIYNNCYLTKPFEVFVNYFDNDVIYKNLVSRLLYFPLDINKGNSVNYYIKD